VTKAVATYSSSSTFHCPLIFISLSPIRQIDFMSVSGADLTGVLKLFFARLPDPLFTSELYKSYASVASKQPLSMAAFHSVMN